MQATYSPEDNKLRIYAETRLDRETYERARAVGYKWAPKQDCFIAPMWTPDREDFALELCGEIDDEDTGLMERQEARAERFGDYSSNRARDAQSAEHGVRAIADNIPLGQPILVGHHSEKRARRDQKRIEDGMRKTIRLWDQSEYWSRRAAAAIAHAKYKERPDVRQRRIRKLEAEHRKMLRDRKDANQQLRFWLGMMRKKDGGRLEVTHRAALWFTSHSCGRYYSFPLSKYPRSEPASQYEGDMSLWSALGGTEAVKGQLEHAVCTVEQAKELAVKSARGCQAWANRWLRHLDNRLAYERAMLADQGGTVADQTKPEKGGGCKCWASPRGGWSYIQKVNRVSVTVLDNWGNGGANFRRTIPFDKLAGVMSAAAVDEARQTGRLIESQDKTGFALLERKPESRPEPEPKPQPEKDSREEMREALKAGVQVAVAPQLFPTPVDIAERMAKTADLQPGQRMLEPSAGTGRLIDAAVCCSPLEWSGEFVAVEIDAALVGSLKCKYKPGEAQGVTVKQGDFLECNGDLGEFDRIIMNPPFERGADIKHIQHALKFLRPGGKLVALCAAGPRQVEALQPLADTWEGLPEGSFKNAGTMVRVAMLTISKPAEHSKPRQQDMFEPELL